MSIDSEPSHEKSIGQRLHDIGFSYEVIEPDATPNTFWIVDKKTPGEFHVFAYDEKKGEWTNLIENMSREEIETMMKGFGLTEHPSPTHPEKSVGDRD